MREASEDLTFLVKESAALGARRRTSGNNAVIVLTCCPSPAGRYCTVDGCTIARAIIQIPNEESAATCSFHPAAFDLNF